MKSLALLLLGLLIVSPASAADSEAPVRSLRVLVQNIYGRHEKDCETRYRALAAHILSATPPFDVVVFNEHWKVPLDHWVTCDADVLTSAIEQDGRYAGAGHSVQHVPAASGLQVSGGDSIFTLHSIAAVHAERFSNSNNFPLSGYVLARVDVAPGVSVDVWDAHFEALSDRCDDACRLKQGAQFAASIKSLSVKSGNPVLLTGDYNTGGPLSSSEKPPYSGNGGYDKIMELLGRPRDLWLELGKGSGLTYDCANNHTETCTERERIDYVLVPEAPEIVEPSSQYVLVPRSIEVVRWQTPTGADISDHYGLDATLEIQRRPAPGVSSLGAGVQAFAARLAEEGLPSLDDQPHAAR